MLDVPPAVREKALATGAGEWLAALPALVGDLAARWSLTIGRVFRDGTEALVPEATCEDGTAAVLKLALPGLQNTTRREEILVEAASRVWRPAPDSGLPTGADKARHLAEFIPATWEATGRPCSERVVEHALACVRRRATAHDDARAVLVHGDVHGWNTLEAPGGGFKLVDPDGLLAEPEYDLGVLLREDPLEGDPATRARRLAERTGLDAAAIAEWGVVERVATGLLATRIGLQPVGQQMLAVADELARYPYGV